MSKQEKTAWQLLRAKYPAGECVLLEEVSDTTGGRNRSADYIVVNLWPSRGNSIIGFERKSFRSDWLGELKKPNKQEAIFKFCDYFYLLTDKENVAKLEEIPVNWGWMHSDGSRLKIIKDAVKLSPVPCTRQFICSMLRRADAKAGWIKEEDIEERITERVERDLVHRANEADRKIKDYDALVKKIKDFEEASGIDIGNRWDWRSGKEIGDAVQRLMRWDDEKEVNKLTRLQKSTENILETIKKEIEVVSEISSQISAATIS